MLHLLELINRESIGRSGVYAQAKIPIDGNIVGFTVYQETAPGIGNGGSNTWDLFTGSTGGTVSAFTNPAHRPAIAIGSIEASANSAAFPIACLRGETVELRKSGSGSNGGYSPTGLVIINDGLLDELAVIVTTASIAHLAEATITAPLGKSFVLNRIKADRAARVTVYRTPAARTADAARAIGDIPTAGAGVLVDVNLTGSALDLPLTPIIYGSTGETPRTGNIAIRVQNRSGATNPVIVTFTANKFES